MLTNNPSIRHAGWFWTSLMMAVFISKKKKLLIYSLKWHRCNRNTCWASQSYPMSMFVQHVSCLHAVSQICHKLFSKDIIMHPNHVQCCNCSIAPRAPYWISALSHESRLKNVSSHSKDRDWLGGINEKSVEYHLGFRLQLNNKQNTEYGFVLRTEILYWFMLWNCRFRIVEYEIFWSKNTAQCPPFFDHRAMHKDGGNSICSKPCLAFFGLQKLVCRKMCLQSDFCLLAPHTHTHSDTHNSVLSTHIHIPQRLNTQY